MDDDLKALVQNTLQKRGLLGKFKAQLKHAVISVIEEQDPSAVKCAGSPLETKYGGVAADLIRDYNRCYGLNYTNSVFTSEASLSGDGQSTEDLRRRLDLPRSELPVLLQLIELWLEGKPPPREEEVYAEEFEHDSNTSESKDAGTTALPPVRRTNDDDNYSDIAVSDVSATESEIHSLAKFDHVETYGGDPDSVQKFGDSDDDD